jgi:hypothetical protein
MDDQSDVEKAKIPLTREAVEIVGSLPRFDERLLMGDDRWRFAAGGRITEISGSPVRAEVHTGKVVDYAEIADRGGPPKQIPGVPYVLIRRRQLEALLLERWRLLGYREEDIPSLVSAQMERMIVAYPRSDEDG